MRRKIQNRIFEVCYFLESVIAVIVGIAVVILCIKLFKDMIFDAVYSTGEEVLVDVLDSAMTLAIGVEFIKMLCKHTPQTVVEVLLFAIAKQLVVFHTTPLENLMNVAAIAGLFAIRKFLLRREDKPERSSKKKDPPMKDTVVPLEENKTIINTDLLEKA